MTTLKVIKNRIKSVTNTQKITQSMKLVSASKFVKAERDLKNARPLGEGATMFYEEIGVVPPLKIDSQLLVAMSSDNGLCGSIHSSVAKAVHTNIVKEPSLETKTKLICVGSYPSSILMKTHSKKLIWTADQVGKKFMTFNDAALIALKINECITEHNFTITKVYYNKSLSSMSFRTSVEELHDENSVNTGKKFPLYNDIDDEILKSYLEFSYIVMIYWMMKEGACSEYAARMVAMGNASKNAGTMADQLQKQYNRSRQATITQELTEIIAGANAVSK